MKLAQATQSAAACAHVARAAQEDRSRDEVDPPAPSGVRVDPALWFLLPKVGDPSSARRDSERTKNR